MFIVRRIAWFLPVLILCSLCHAQQFKVGFGKRDVTPKKPTPMWGYGERHSALSTGVLDPLYAKAVVIDVGSDKLALVGLDIGRSPDAESMAKIRAVVKDKAGVNYVMIVGSHTHHGPVIELKDEDGKGKGKYDDAIAYVTEMENLIAEAIVEAAGSVKDAKVGWGSARVEMNRNRHTKREPKPTDSELSVLRFDDVNGQPIAIVTNFAAHPTNLDPKDLRFSADYPGHMMNTVETTLKTNCVFLQGAAGDMSCKKTEQTNTIDAFGAALGQEVLKIAKGISSSVPANPSIQCMDEDFEFESRIEFTNPQTVMAFQVAFFPELANAFVDELKDNKLRPHLTTTLLNGEVAIVGASGEFFCNHSNRLKERLPEVKTIFVGYCNGHHMYFPTIEAASEGGYGASPQVSWVSLGGPEQMMNKALINVYTMLGKFN